MPVPRKHLTLDEKKELIENRNAGESIGNLIKKFGVGKSTVYDILQNQTSIVEIVHDNVGLKQKRIKTSLGESVKNAAPLTFQSQQNFKTDQIFGAEANVSNNVYEAQNKWLSIVQEYNSFVYQTKPNIENKVLDGVSILMDMDDLSYNNKTSKANALNQCALVTATGKRTDYINWDEMFMGVALLASKRSKDPCTQVGAAIVNDDNIIVGVGYNGMPIGCSDDEFPWSKASDNPLENKYFYVCHAEMNAIMNKNISSVAGATIYTTRFPCNECAKIIIQSKIKRIVYLHKKPEKLETIAAQRLFTALNVELSQFVPTCPELVLNFM